MRTAFKQSVCEFGKFPVGLTTIVPKAFSEKKNY
jgi:hypothetical protein